MKSVPFTQLHWACEVELHTSIDVYIKAITSAAGLTPSRQIRIMALTAFSFCTGGYSSSDGSSLLSAPPNPSTP
eukprot:m.52249 g.52249  ORF g.52249 m.52249 type:complete len:74 (+) comp12689_c0_seq1:960-1181(+)